MTYDRSVFLLCSYTITTYLWYCTTVLLPLFYIHLIVVHYFTFSYCPQNLRNLRGFRTTTLRMSSKLSIKFDKDPQNFGLKRLLILLELSEAII